MNAFSAKVKTQELANITNISDIMACANGAYYTNSTPIQQQNQLAQANSSPDQKVTSYERQGDIDVARIRAAIDHIEPQEAADQILQTQRKPRLCKTRQTLQIKQRPTIPRAAKADKEPNVEPLP